MALTPSGAISLNDINTSTGKASGTQITMDGTAVRCISDTNSGTVSMSSLRGKNVAGGTITSAKTSSTSKGVVSTYWGRRAQTETGSTTVGNITTLWPNVNTSVAVTFTAFYASKASNQSTYGTLLNIISTSNAGYNNTFRLRVGSNNNAVLAISTYVANTMIYTNTVPSNTIQTISDPDVSVTRDWVFTGLT